MGSFSLEELRARHAAGELTGGEYVQAEGMPDWQPLAVVLEQGYRVVPPPLPARGSGAGPHLAIIWTLVGLGILIFAGIFALSARNGYLGVNRAHAMAAARRQALTAASKPVVGSPTTLTEADTWTSIREFRARQWLDGYEKHGRRHPECDAEIIRLIQAWIARDDERAPATNGISLPDESAKLAADTNCTDPLALTVIAWNTARRSVAIPLLERALDGFPQSDYQAFPQFYATVLLARRVGHQPGRVSALDLVACQRLEKCFADGSITTNEQQGIAEVFVHGWGREFFSRNAAAVVRIARGTGPDFQWLTLVLTGEQEINSAWATRGTGDASLVTRPSRSDFQEHLKSARASLQAAWNLQPRFPLASCRMMTVELGDSSGIGAMRLWFDRTVAAQIDYPGAWSEMRWGLRPRAYGDLYSMLTFGRTAVNTGRYDTDIPRKYIDSIGDVEAAEGLPASHRDFGRTDIWPDVQRMYEGYIAEPTQSAHRADWQTSYAVVAYLAGQYDVSRAQLEALDWRPAPRGLLGWHTDLALLPLEVAARTGSLGKQIAHAEIAYKNGRAALALIRYTALETNSTDARTREFIKDRLASLRVAPTLTSGDWAAFFPWHADDPNWIVGRGEIQQIGGGALVMNSATNGHSLFCRTPLGSSFEVRGGFEVVQPSDQDFFQAGLVLGVPDIDQRHWYAFRLERNETGDFASLGRGWTTSETLRPVHLNDGTNVFDFIFQDGKVTATVNGEEVFHATAPPASVVVPGDSFSVGLGALTTANTVIRYRDVQVRKLD